MLIKVPLRVLGLDLRRSSEFARLPEDLLELDWESRGEITLANALIDSAGDAVSEVLDWARRITKHIDGARVGEVYDELVAISDIASRAAVSAESVRLWSRNERRTGGAAFPPPAQWLTTGGKEMKLYRWREVLQWLRTEANLEPDEGITYLDSWRIAEINAELAPADVQYQPLPHSMWQKRVPTSAGGSSLETAAPGIHLRPLPVAL
jgi:transposase